MIRYFISTALLLAILLLLGCETNPPNTPNVPSNPDVFGQAEITSSIDGAKIFINDEDTDEVTPHTFTLKTGEYSVRVEKENYIQSTKTVTVEKDVLTKVNFELVQESFQKIVLLEHFSNSSCGPCIIANGIIEELKHEVYHEKLAIVKFTAGFPSPNDPMYLANTADSKSRVDYYNVQRTPEVVIDGREKPSAKDEEGIRAAIDSRLNSTPKFYLNVESNVEGGLYKSNIKLRLLDQTDLNIEDIIMQVVVTELEINYDEPPGSNGETVFHNVMRQMLPANNGTSLKNIDLDSENSFDFEVGINSGWNSERLNTVVYIQNSKTKEVYQAASFK